MKIGILCEGEKTDKPVLEKILCHKFPGTPFDVRGTTKQILFETGDIELNKLFNDGAERVLIIWDLLPLGHQMGVASQWSERPNRMEQRQKLLELLCASTELSPMLQQQAKHLAHRYGFEATQHNHPNQMDDLFKLACVCYALDGWLLSDHYVLRQLAGTPARPVNRLDPMPNRPDVCTDPVGTLQRVFRSAPNKRFKYYNKHDHNKEIAQAYIDLDRLNKMNASLSYRRVIDAIAGWVRA